MLQDGGDMIPEKSVQVSQKSLLEELLPAVLWESQIRQVQSLPSFLILNDLKLLSGIFTARIATFFFSYALCLTRDSCVPVRSGGKSK